MNFPVTKRFLTWLSRPLLLFSLLLSIPAFYFLLDDVNEGVRVAGRALYAIVALLMAFDSFLQWRKNKKISKGVVESCYSIYALLLAVFSVVCLLISTGAHGNGCCA
ncbi:hypothetical protein [Undibacterium sp. TJN19]|uniref:hypothetical protein n=1 Tax=Undibacterium sp. TJN19 TaxID=3413055 RepID=UPI003BF1768E